MVASRFPLRVPGTNAWFSISDTFFITSALLFGPAPATVTMALDSLVMSYGLSSEAAAICCSTAARPAVAFWIGAQVVLRAVGHLARCTAPLSAPTCWSCPLAAFAAIYFVLNSGMTAVAVALEKRHVGGRRLALALRPGLPQLVRRRVGGLPAGAARAVPELPGDGRGGAAAGGHPPGDAVVDRPHRRRRTARRDGRPPLPVDDRRAVDGDRSEGRRDQQPHPSRAALRDGPGEGAGRARRADHEGDSRPRRCCTTPASWPCPNASSTSPAS